MKSKPTKTSNKPVVADKEIADHVSYTITDSETFGLILMALTGLASLVKVGYGPGDWCGGLAVYHAIQSSSSRVSELHDTLRNRFKALHGDPPHFLPEDKEIPISKEEIAQLEEALAPFCAFVDLIRHHDLGSENETATNAVAVGELIERLARQTITSLRSRFAETGRGAR